jgi:hypothetical protein
VSAGGVPGHRSRKEASMSTVAPVVRHMLLCRDGRRDPSAPGRVDLLGLLVSVRAGPTKSYPLQLPDLTAFAQLTGRHGEGIIHVTLREADTETLIYDGPEQTLAASTNPLTVHMATIRISGCVLPQPGLYWVQLCYNDEIIAEEPLTAR